MLLLQDRSLLDGFRRGDKAALEGVFGHYAPRVATWASRGFTYSSRGAPRRFRGFTSPADMHDVLHEVFRAAFEERARQSYSGLKPFEGYLFVIARNVCLKKARLRGSDHVGTEDLESIPSSIETPEEQVAREEERRRVRAYLHTLSSEERAFVDLRFTEQHSQNAVGEQLGWSRKKVRIKEESIRRGLIRFLARARSGAEVREVMHDGAR